MAKKGFCECIFQYRRAVCDLEAFVEASQGCMFNGYIRYRKEKRKLKDGSQGVYVCAYLVIAARGADGRWKRKETYIRKDEVVAVVERLRDKRQNRKKLRELQKQAAYWEVRLNRAMKREKIDPGILKEIEAERKEHNQYIKKDKYYKTNIITALGEFVRSRGECLVANLAFALKIPYFYEKKVELELFDANRVEYVERLVRPDFIFPMIDKYVLMELFGMTDCEDYMEGQAQKLENYREAGYLMGENLICIACKDRQNIDSRKLADVLMDMVMGILPKEMVWV